jgi:hypothetical protein
MLGRVGIYQRKNRASLQRVAERMVERNGEGHKVLAGSSMVTEVAVDRR